MKTIESNSEKLGQGIQRGYLFLIVASFIALVLTFAIAISGFGFAVKIAAFVATLAIYSIILFGAYRNVEMESEFTASDTAQDAVKLPFTREVDEKLAVLDEAGRFFSASLKSDDMFRLVASRIGEIIEHQTAVLFSMNSENKLEAVNAYGEKARAITTVTLGREQGIAGRAFLSGNVERASDLSDEQKCIDEEILEDFGSAIAAPLKSVEKFAVIVLYGGKGREFSNDDAILLEAVTERVSPLLVSSFSFEQSISNSMTDSLTNLPNERAFYVVLENQIAEAHRYQDSRPLTVLALDIKGFAEFNRLFGHSTGDNLLEFASKVIDENLRDMDFLCRSMNDEFWVVLPTASNEISETIVDRIEAAFDEKSFALPGGKEYRVELNSGTATFLHDGESTNQLLQKALLRKKQSKPDEESSVIMFPKEYVN